LNNIFNISRSVTGSSKILISLEYHDKLDPIRRGWDIDPLDVIASKITGLKLPAHIIKKYVIGDFGCGRCRLADVLKENRMYSFDHHDILDDRIIPCDIKSVPLKNGQLDIAVFCLSLMGETKRCLTKNGLLFIAETTRSLDGRLHNLREIVKEQGFEINSDEVRGDFTFIEARKL